jgi:hypothetical protein
VAKYATGARIATNTIIATKNIPTRFGLMFLPIMDVT